MACQLSGSLQASATQSSLLIPPSAPGAGRPPDRKGQSGQEPQPPRVKLGPSLPWGRGGRRKQEKRKDPGCAGEGAVSRLPSLPAAGAAPTLTRPYSLPVDEEERRGPQPGPAPSRGRGGAGGGEPRASGRGGGGGGGGSSLEALESAAQPLCTWFPGSGAACGGAEGPASEARAAGPGPGRAAAGGSERARTSSLCAAMPGRAARGSAGRRPRWR